MDGAHAMGVPDDIDEITDTPTVKEYKKLKRVMKIMVKFYRDGTETKLDNFNEMCGELKKLQVDLDMVNTQLQVLEKFPNHPKRKAYETELSEEKQNLEKMKASWEIKAQEFKTLYEWSKNVVDATYWLEVGLDDYCINHLGMKDLLGTEHIKEVQPPKPLSIQEYIKYKSGLDEITFNLEESQDFFTASVDGRLQKFHETERDIILSQLEALKNFPPMNARRLHWEAELSEDLEYVKSSMTVDEPGMARRGRMLSMHSDFLKVLRWYREKLHSFREGFKDNPEIVEFERTHTRTIEGIEKVANNIKYIRTMPSTTTTTTTTGVCPVKH